MGTERLSMTELRRRWYEVVRRAEAGEVFEVTHRGRLCMRLATLADVPAGTGSERDSRS